VCDRRDQSPYLPVDVRDSRLSSIALPVALEGLAVVERCVPDGGGGGYERCLLCVSALMTAAGVGGR
jgi:hypothetical protein